MTGALWRDIFSNKYLLEENLVANVRQKVKSIFFMRCLEVQSSLTDCREHSVLGPLKRFHPHRFFFVCLFHLPLHHLCLLQTIILRLDASHHWLQIRNLVTRLSLNLFYPLLTSATLWPHWVALPITLTLSHYSFLPLGLNSSQTKLWFLPQHHINFLVKIWPPFPISFHITLAQKSPTWLNPSVHLHWVIYMRIWTQLEERNHIRSYLCWLDSL